MRTPREIIAEHPSLSKDSLIPLLQEVQTENGYLGPEAMEEIASAMSVPVSRVYGVATFYKQFRFSPLGEHVILLCRGTACHVRFSAFLAEHIRRRLKLDPEGNSRDGRFTVIKVACLGACSIAPVIKLDGDFYGHLTPEKLDKLLDALEVEK
ncbi:MAG: NAD(P)H-dependent oxidoreductase subunit E [Candidatus Aminicenantes bacterium]|nr:NAD(P)H-dependent oxidoreductase subunit E [Candidatus Aminicenantes bacterium]